MIDLVKSFNDNVSRNKPMEAASRLMDVQSELGELAKEYLKSTNYGESEFKVTENFELELGDVLYSLISLGLELNIDLKTALEKVVLKYQKRIDEKKNMGSGR